MAQGGVVQNIFSGNIGIGDGPNLDAFSRLRVSNPESLWDAQSQYNANTVS